MKRPFYASGLAHYPQGSGFFIYGRFNPLGILVYDKPFKTFDEQIDILENKYNLVIESREMALTALQSLMTLLTAIKMFFWLTINLNLAFLLAFCICLRK